MRETSDSAEASSTYHARAVRALAWSISGRFAVQAVRFGFGVALARLLSPDQFGLFAMVVLFVQFGMSIVDLGFADALVQKRDVDEAHRSSVFWTRLATGAVMASGMYVLAPRIAAFYEVADVAGLARTLAPIFLLGASSTVARALVEGRLDFRTVVRIECTVAAIAGAVAVALAWRGFGVTSLVVHMLLWLALEDVLFLRASGWRPRWQWSAAALGDLLGFGTSRMATRTLGYWSRHVDELLVGRILGVTSLGLYTRAFNLIQVPVLYVSRATHRALFPSLAEIQDDPERVRRTHLRTTGAVALATVPMCLGLAALAEPVVLGLFGPQWREMVPLVRILSVAGLLQSITSLSASLFLSQGRPDLQLRVIVLQSVTTIVAVLVGRRWGVTGVAVAYVLAFVASSGPTIHIAGQLVGLTVADVVARLRAPLAAGAVMVAIVVLVDRGGLDGADVLVRLGVGMAVGVAVYGLAIRAGRGEAYQDVLHVLRRFVG